MMYHVIAILFFPCGILPCIARRVPRMMSQCCIVCSLIEWDCRLAHSVDTLRKCYSLYCVFVFSRTVHTKVLRSRRRALTRGLMDNEVPHKVCSLQSIVPYTPPMCVGLGWCRAAFGRNALPCFACGLRSSRCPYRRL